MSFLSKLFGSSKAPSTQHSTDNSISIESSVTLTSRYVEVKQRTKGLLPSIPIAVLDGYISPSGGFVNYARFQVIGINPSTKRKNKRIYEVRFEEDARHHDGLNHLKLRFFLPFLRQNVNLNMQKF